MGALRGTALVALALGLAREPACGDPGDPPGGPNAPCTRERDCSSGLACVGGVCTGGDAGPAPLLDAGPDAVDAARD
ncbi:MAG: hypothetical protein JNL38_00415 [Myxococcales bacterium]|jgi:hypothetical protein|nr:hypothetical protein [Myxococcales bacterium]